MFALLPLTVDILLVLERNNSPKRHVVEFGALKESVIAVGTVLTLFEPVGVETEIALVQLLPVQLIVISRLPQAIFEFVLGHLVNDGVGEGLDVVPIGVMAEEIHTDKGELTMLARTDTFNDRITQRRSVGNFGDESHFSRLKDHQGCQASGALNHLVRVAHLCLYLQRQSLDRVRS